MVISLSSISCCFPEAAAMLVLRQQQLCNKQLQTSGRVVATNYGCMKVAACIGLAYALAWFLHMQMHARAGACICTCISQKSLHGFLALYLHDASPVLHGVCMMQVPYLHGVCMGAACICKSHASPTNRLCKTQVATQQEYITPKQNW